MLVRWRSFFVVGDGLVGENGATGWFETDRKLAMPAAPDLLGFGEVEIELVTHLMFPEQSRIHDGHFQVC